MYYFGYILLGALRVAVVVAIFLGIVKLINKPVSKTTATVCGIVLFLASAVVAIIIAGEAILNIIFGGATGYFAYTLSLKYFGRDTHHGKTPTHR